MTMTAKSGKKMAHAQFHYSTLFIIFTKKHEPTTRAPQYAAHLPPPSASRLNRIAFTLESRRLSSVKAKALRHAYHPRGFPTVRRLYRPIDIKQFSVYSVFFISNYKVFLYLCALISIIFTKT